VAEFNTTEHKGFLHGFVESLSVILVSELGDKTFFIAAILAMRNNKLTVFLVRVERREIITVRGQSYVSRLPKY
jgi:putative Ca2+/H+ antiporter (TMEM165/GDT1 family)